MKKNECGARFGLRRLLIKSLLMTKMAILLILAFSTQTYAHSYGQGISLKLEKVKLKTVFKSIEEQGDFRFVYKDQLLRETKLISIDVQNASLTEVMDKILQNTNLTYRRLSEQLIVIIGDKALESSITTSAIPVTGKVLNERGEPLSGVSILEKGTNNGTTSKPDGSFTLDVSSNNAILVFSYVGFKSVEVAANDAGGLANVILLSEDNSLSDIVVIGYGTARKSDLTGSVAVVKADKLLDKPVANVSQALQGRVAGVEVNINTSAPGEPAKIRIRGTSSLNSNLDPLYVVDGVIGVDANILNPNDIVSLEVLKDASATAIYGARGANGVIMITTKRGKNGATSISLDSYGSLATLQRHVRSLDANEFMQVYNLAYANAQKYDPQGYADGKYVPNNPANFPNLFDASGKPLYNTNWEKEVYKPAFSQSHQLSLQGGNEKSQYSLSGGFLDQNGLMIESWFKRYSLRFTLDNQVNRWLKLGGAINLVKSTERMISDGNGGLNVPRMVAEGIPIIPIKYPDGKWGGNGDWPGMEGGSNPVNIAKNRYTLRNILQTVGNVYALVNITKDLNFRSDFGYTISGRKDNFYSGRELSSLSANQKGVANIASWLSNYWQSENYFTWNKKISTNHKLTALLGLSWQKNYYEYVNAQSQNFIDDYWAWHNLAVGTIRPDPGSYDEQWTMNSYFARINYNISDKYLFTVTGRYDGASKFGVNNKYAFFPSVGAAWRISNEEFLRDNNVISDLKLRASIGSTGNQEIGTYNSIQLLGSGTTTLGNERQPTVSRSSFGNPDLRWERSNQFDIGLELGLFDNRLILDADYYYRVTKDLLLSAPIPWTSGLSSVYENIGSLSNTGFEFALNTVNIRKRDIEWTTNITFAANKNKIIKLGQSGDDIYPGPWFLGQTNIYRIGWPVGTFWGYIREGVWSEKDADEAAKYNLRPGDLKWKDLNGDQKIDDQDLTRIGRAYPKWTMNVGNTINYRNFDFSFDIRFVMGVNTALTIKHSVEDRQAIANSLSTVLGAWTPQNQNSMIAEVRLYNAGYQTHFDSWWVEDGSFIRGQNFVLGYSLPSATMSKWKMNRLRFYVSAQNLFLITKYTGYDPEVMTFGGNTPQNMDFFSYPRPRVINIGFNLGF